ncbi:unnamed protein product [Closterium sp. Naga37s-1]|nr:unnamed protein product [Closterium sp. Naga37s-1]
MEIKELRDILQHTLLQHPRFHSRLVSSPGGVPAWVLMDAADVDLEYHVVEEEASDVDSSQRHVAGDEGGGGGGKGGFTKRWVTKSISSLAAQCYQNRLLLLTPLTHLLLTLSPLPTTTRIHHALGDGISLMSLLLAATRRTDNPDLLPSLPGSLGASTRQKTSSSSEPPLSSSDGSSSGTNRSSISEGGSSKGKEAAAELSRKKGSFRRLLTLLWVALVRAVLAVWRMVRVTVNTTMQILEYLAVLLWVADTPTPIKGGPHLHCHALPRCFAVSPEMSLEDVSTIRKAVKGTTVNDVMLTVISGGIERYLVLLGITNGGSPLPHRLRVSALALFNLRPAPGLQERLPDGSLDVPEWAPAHAARGMQALAALCASRKDSLMAHGTYLNGRLLMPLVGCKAQCWFSWWAPAVPCASRKESLMAHWTYLNGRMLMPLVGCKASGVVCWRYVEVWYGEVLRYGMVRCVEVWSGMVRCVEVWYGMVRCVEVWYGMVRCVEVWYGMVRCVEVWYGMVRCVEVWYGMVRCVEVWYGMVRCVEVWYGMVRCVEVWYGMVRCVEVWYGMVRYGMVRCVEVWYGMVRCVEVWYGMVRCVEVWYGMVRCVEVWYGMVRCVEVWYGMVRCVEVWYGLVRCVEVWYGMVRCVEVWYGMVRCVEVWYGLVRCVEVWYGMVRCVEVWYGMVRCVEVWYGMVRCVEVWSGMVRCVEVWSMLLFPVPFKAGGSEDVLVLLVGTNSAVCFEEGLPDGSLDVPQWAPAHAARGVQGLLDGSPDVPERARLLMPLLGCKPVAVLTRRSLDETTLSLSNVLGPYSAYPFLSPLPGFPTLNPLFLPTATHCSLSQPVAVLTRRSLDQTTLSLSSVPIAALTRRSLDQTTLSLSSVPVAALTRHSLDQTTLSLSNVVGPLEEVALHGHPIAAIIPSVVGSNHVSLGPSLHPHPNSESFFSR